MAMMIICREFLESVPAEYTVKKILSAMGDAKELQIRFHGGTEFLGTITKIEVDK